MKTILNISGLRIARGDTVILDDLSWEVKSGEHWVILGPNGSGKTSLLSALAAYLTPSDGTVEVLGERFGESDWRELRKSIGMVSSSVRQRMAEEEVAVETVVSGKYAMIDFWGRVTPQDRRAATQILRQTECLHLAERPWRVLSQGERQRILIGRALMAKPRLLILDEPCSGLDPVAREHFLQFVERLGRQKNAPALVLVTHHVEEITPAFTHVLILKKGRVLATGEKKKALTSRNLAKAFDAKMRLSFSNNRYALKVQGVSRKVA
jgi:iron complex transport system ATP-binding protein